MPDKKKNKNKDKPSGGNTNVHTGKLEVTRSGMGFVVVPGQEQDILIKREHMGAALNGDEVRVEVRGHNDGSRRPEGRITEVTHRKQSEFSGTLQVHDHFAFLVPDSDKVPMDIYIPLHLLKGGKHGDKAMAKIVEWTGKSKNPIGEVTSILTNESRNEIAMQAILTENGFQLTFPDDVLEDAARYPDVIDKKEIKKRRDMRDTLTMTIDPVDAKDFDDALSFKQLKGGWYEIGVHIADVGHYMEAGSALDKEAYQRATSVYLPDRVLPMLPERLSNELCSLRPNEDKYTFSAIFQVNKQGKVKDTWIGKTLIHSDRRYSYEEVQEIIEGQPGDNKKEVLILNEMAQNLRSQRFQKGAINFSSTEVRFQLDENGKPIGIVVKESKQAHQLIEEFMLLANRSVAEYVSKIRYKDEAVPFPYRVHDVPVEEKLKVFALFARRFGVTLELGDPAGLSKSFNAMLNSVRGKPEQHVLEQLGIRTMSKAVYTTQNIGHYGLGFADYCHFTSPIRRYPDVLVHRILQQCIEGDIKPIKNLEAQCRHCSDQERRAMESERTANKYKQVEFMQEYLGDEFDAVISGVANFGFWAETVEYKCEGMISMNDLMDIDDFEFVEAEYALVGRRSGLRFAMGDSVRVRVAATNLDKRQIDYAVVGLPAASGNSGAGRRSAPSGKRSGGGRPGGSSRGNAGKQGNKQGNKQKSTDGKPGNRKNQDKYRTKRKD